MRNRQTITLTAVVIGSLFSATWAAPPPQFEPPRQSQAPEQSEVPQPSEAVKPAQQPDKKRPEGKKKPPRDSDKIVDIAPERATHEEVESLKIKFKRLAALSLRGDGSLLACDAEAKAVKIISPAGELTGDIQLDFAPEAMDVAADGTIYCGGKGKLVKLDSTGRLLKTVDVPQEVAPTSTEKPAAEAAKPPARKRRTKSRPRRISGIAVSGADVFVAFGSGWSVGSKSKLYRFDQQLENPHLLAEGLRACCQRCDIVARDGVLYLAENAAHRVVLFDRDGNRLAKWGEQGRKKLEDFGACCNPMNLCFDADGQLYTSESGMGRVKRYTPDGKFIDLVGYVGTDRFWNRSGLASSCSNIAIAATPDGERVYVMDYRNNLVRVLQKRAPAGNANSGKQSE